MLVLVLHTGGARTVLLGGWPRETKQLLLLAKQCSSLHATRKGVGRAEKQRESDMSDGDAGTKEAGEAAPPIAPLEGAGTDEPSTEAFRVQAMQVYRR